MNPRFYVKINPNFKFKKVSLNNQSRLNSKSNIKNILYNLEDYLSINLNNKEPNKNNNIKDKLFEKEFNKYKEELKELINNKVEKILSPIKPDKKNSDVHTLRTKLLQNNNKLQRIDFNINIIGSNKEKNDLKLNVEHYLSQIKINKKISRNTEGQKKFNNCRSEETKDEYNQYLIYKLKNSKINKSLLSIKSDRLYLPSISCNIIRKNNKIRSLMKKMEKNLYYSKEKTNNKEQVNDDGKKYARSMLNNINSFNKNKDLTIRINDMKKNSDIFKYINHNANNIISNSINNKKDNENNEETNINKEIFKRKEDDKYMIYESTKKYIDTDKIYNSKKSRLANIPNVSLDKGFKNIKTLELNVINIKNENLDIPICINKRNSKII